MSVFQSLSDLLSSFALDYLLQPLSSFGFSAAEDVIYQLLFFCHVAFVHSFTPDMRQARQAAPEASTLIQLYVPQAMSQIVSHCVWRHVYV